MSRTFEFRLPTWAEQALEDVDPETGCHCFDCEMRNRADEGWAPATHSNAEWGATACEEHRAQVCNDDRLCCACRGAELLVWMMAAPHDLGVLVLAQLDDPGACGLGEAIVAAKRCLAVPA